MLRIQSENERLVLGTLKDYLELIVYTNWEYYEKEEKLRLLDEIIRLRQVLTANDYELDDDLNARIDRLAIE